MQQVRRPSGIAEGSEEVLMIARRSCEASEEVLRCRPACSRSERNSAPGGATRNKSFAFILRSPLQQSFPGRFDGVAQTTERDSRRQRGSADDRKAIVTAILAGCTFNLFSISSRSPKNLTSFR